jgi:hypothetical protein
MLLSRDPGRFLRFFNICAIAIAAVGVVTTVLGLLADDRWREFLVIVGVTLLASAVVVVVQPRLILRRKNGSARRG